MWVFVSTIPINHGATDNHGVLNHRSAFTNSDCFLILDASKHIIYSLYSSKSNSAKIASDHTITASLVTQEVFIVGHDGWVIIIVYTTAWSFSWAVPMENSQAIVWHGVSHIARESS